MYLVYLGSLLYDEWIERSLRGLVSGPLSGPLSGVSVSLHAIVKIGLSLCTLYRFFPYLEYLRLCYKKPTLYVTSQLIVYLFWLSS